MRPPQLPGNVLPPVGCGGLTAQILHVRVSVWKEIQLLLFVTRSHNWFNSVLLQKGVLFLESQHLLYSMSATVKRNSTLTFFINKIDVYNNYNLYIWNDLLHKTTP